MLRTRMRDDMDPGEVAALAKQAARSRAYGPWSRTDYLLAEIIDRLGDVAFRVVRVHTKKVKPFEPYPRPGVVTKADLPKTAAYKQAHAANIAVLEDERRRHAEKRAAAIAAQQQQRGEVA